MSGNSSLMLILVAALVAIGTLIAWTWTATSSQLKQLEQLPNYADAKPGEVVVLEGRISKNAPTTRAQLVAFSKEVRDRVHNHTEKPSNAAQRWHTTNDARPDLPIVIGDKHIAVTGYKFPSHVTQWQHAIHNEDGTAWTSSNVRYRGFLPDEPIIAIGTKPDANGDTPFKATIVAAGTRSSYREAVSQVRQQTSTWVLAGYAAAAILVIFYGVWSGLLGRSGD